MKRIEKLAIDAWKSTGWDDFATGYPVWHEAYLEGYHQALEDAAYIAEGMRGNPTDKTMIAARIEEAVHALADAEDSDGS